MPNTEPMHYLGNMMAGDEQCMDTLDDKGEQVGPTNVGVVSPSVVGWANPMNPDLVWPSQLAIRRKHLFPEGPFHLN